MNTELKAIELNDTDLDQAAGGFLIFPNGSNLKMGDPDTRDGQNSFKASAGLSMPFTAGATSRSRK